jgi:hypothetical protein
MNSLFELTPLNILNYLNPFGESIWLFFLELDLFASSIFPKYSFHLVQGQNFDECTQHISFLYLLVILKPIFIHIILFQNQSFIPSKSTYTNVIYNICFTGSIFNLQNFNFSTVFS